MRLIHANEIKEALGYAKNISQPEDFDIWTLTSFTSLVYGFIELARVEKSELNKYQLDFLSNQADIDLMEDTLKIALNCNFFEILGSHSGMGEEERMIKLEKEFNETLNKQR